MATNQDVLENRELNSFKAFKEASDATIEQYKLKLGERIKRSEMSFTPLKVKKSVLFFRRLKNFWRNFKSVL